MIDSIVSCIGPQGCDPSPKALHICVVERDGIKGARAKHFGDGGSLIDSLAFSYDNGAATSSGMANPSVALATSNFTKATNGTINNQENNANLKTTRLEDLEEYIPKPQFQSTIQELND
mmetsp:Transcript_23699/g.55202  ORF Transcript_23699/g.55202 Transcript_23699/m.55202 type:complete len:119 (-) Transcript_23699:81-437(-)